MSGTPSPRSAPFPPEGCLLLARQGGEIAGTGFLKRIGTRDCEIKRLYVRPGHRGAGLGRALLVRLVDEARRIGYGRILLDSAVYMTAAHALYRSLGFADTDYYPEGESDESLKPYLVYMEMRL